MRLAALVAFVALAVATAPIACSSSSGDDIPAEGSAEDELRSMTLTEADADKTVPLTRGQFLVVKLETSPATGYAWTIVAADKAIGKPAAVQFIRNGDAAGAGGVDRITWATSADTPVGNHVVKLEYRRPWETDVAAAKTFSFTVNVVSGECPSVDPPGTCEGGQMKPKKDANGCTTGFACVKDCRANGCGSEQTCSYCWAGFTCIASGATC